MTDEKMHRDLIENPFKSTVEWILNHGKLQ